MPSKMLPRTDKNPRLAVTYQEAADSVGVSERTIWELVRSGELPRTSIGRSVRIPVAALHKYIQTKTTQVTELGSSESGVSNV